MYRNYVKYNSLKKIYSLWPSRVLVVVLNRWLHSYNLCLFTPPSFNFQAQWKLNQQEHKEVEKIKMCEKETRNLWDSLGPVKIIFLLAEGNPEFCFCHTAFGGWTGHVGWIPCMRKQQRAQHWALRVSNSHLPTICAEETFLSALLSSTWNTNIVTKESNGITGESMDTYISRCAVQKLSCSARAPEPAPPLLPDRYQMIQIPYWKPNREKGKSNHNVTTPL